MSKSAFYSIVIITYLIIKLESMKYYEKLLLIYIYRSLNLGRVSHFVN